MLALAEWIAPTSRSTGSDVRRVAIVVWLVNVAVGWLIDKVRGPGSPMMWYDLWLFLQSRPRS
jgi:hypothetical protein